ncbi:DNA/RNA helicase domain-containing protein [Gynurincola endophyticus]|uniref:DNA/RNA helicase domain-containing protein n=1 Tax=Gynurincola endophyticus TaxID=2479004 RepID=UPI000F8EF681|nr:DNA/RNA helicase domain-containing protein [Gynurincola endophyticus]
MSTVFPEILIDISEPYSFSKEGLEQIKQNRWAKNQWPLVYFIDSKRKKKKCYIGESTHAITRITSHLANKKKAVLDQILLIGSDWFNKSATLDIESTLIRYMSAEGSYDLMNGNYGLKTHNYYERKIYHEVFSRIWQQLKERQVVRSSLTDIENSQIFKYSPYKSLNEDQYRSLLEILDGLTTKQSNRIFVKGSAGTGKTILATYLMKLLKSDIGAIENEEELDSSNGTLREIRYIRQFQQQYPNARIGLVIAMDSLRATLKDVFRKMPDLNSSMVISPSDTFKGSKYDLLIVDEAHRLRQYKNISWRGPFKKKNKKLGLDNTGTELDWILSNSKNQIFFYDRDQEVRPSDVAESRFLDLLKNKATLKLKLHSQMRVMGGSDYISFVDELLHLKLETAAQFEVDEYELKVFDSIIDMRNMIQEREQEYGLCRMIAGYSWSWSSKKDKKAMDIEIEGIHFQWNQVNRDWINSDTAVNEIGCIHTTMGYDLNYGAVIFGPEISYNSAKQCIEVDPDQYHDKYGKQGVDGKQLKKYIINIYKNMMYRGIRGTFVYACDAELREYLKQHIPVYGVKPPALKILSKEEAHGNNRAVAFIDILAAAGSFSDNQLPAQQKWIELPNDIKDRDNHFVCKVVGESMNKRIKNGSYCLFRRDTSGSREGKIVLVQSTAIQDADFGSGYTVKEYHSTKYISSEEWRHASITLKPLSDDPRYQDIELFEDDLQSLKVIGIFKNVVIF